MRYWLVILLGARLVLAPFTPSSDLNVQYLVRFRTLDLKTAQIEQLAAARNLHVLARLRPIDVWVLQPIDPRRPIDLASLKADPSIAWVEVNGVVHATGTVPNDPWYTSQQSAYLQLMGLPAAWELARGDAQPIAFVDTGVDLDHPDLAHKVWHNAAEIPANSLDDDGNGYVDDITGWNFVSNTPVPQDDANHGSHVAGSAAAQTNNSLGMAGISWNATIMPIKVLNATATGTYSDTAAGIIYAADNGARIINLSLGGDYSAAIEAAVSYAQSRGCLLIASTGNDGLSTIDYPARLPGVIAVGSSSLNDSRSTFSNYGPEIAVVAPGENILSANRFGSYAFLSGTSMATAHVSGLAALIWSVRPDYTAITVAQTITSTAHDIASSGWDTFTGWGRIDAYAAVRQAQHGRIYLPLIVRQAS